MLKRTESWAVRCILRPRFFTDGSKYCRCSPSNADSFRNLTKSILRVFVRRYQRFGGKHCLHLQGSRGWRQYVPAKRWRLPTCPHGDTTRKANVGTFTAVGTSVSQTQLSSSIALFTATALSAGCHIYRQIVIPVHCTSILKNQYHLTFTPVSRNQNKTSIRHTLMQWLDIDYLGISTRRAHKPNWQYCSHKENRRSTFRKYEKSPYPKNILWIAIQRKRKPEMSAERRSWNLYFTFL
jgi:hypothetical protein